jgi:hypothetical protein
MSSYSIYEHISNIKLYCQCDGTIEEDGDEGHGAEGAKVVGEEGV